MNFPDGLPAYTPTDTKISNILTFTNLSDVEQSQKIVNRLFFIKSENIYYRYDTDNDTMVPAFSGSSEIYAGLGLNFDENTLNLDTTIYDLQYTKQDTLKVGNNINFDSGTNEISTVINPTFEEVYITKENFDSNNLVPKHYVDTAIDNAINAIVPPDFPKRNGIYELGKIYTFPIFIRNSATGDQLPFPNVNGNFTFSIDGFCHVSFDGSLYVQPPFFSPTTDPVEFNIPFELNAGTKPSTHIPFGTETSHYYLLINSGFTGGTSELGINIFIIDNTVSTTMMRAYNGSSSLPLDLPGRAILVSQMYAQTSQIRYSYSYMPKYPLVPINPYPL